MNRTTKFLLLGIVFIAAPAVSMAKGGGSGSGNTDVATLDGIVSAEGPVAGSVAEELPANLDPEEANHGAYEGGDSGTSDDAGRNINLSNMNKNGGIDIPTGARPSPLFGVQPFTQQMLRFEEFGPQPLPHESDIVEGNPFPAPLDAISGPNWDSLDNFLAQDIYPYPTRKANDIDLNPWQPEIEAFLGRDLNTPPAEGRPPGEEWAHQRWDEFYPEVYFQTAQAGAHANGGLRDPLQSHHYAVGEFGPEQSGHTGLYHNTVGTPGFEGTTKGIPIKFHADMPVEGSNTVWTFDGTLPPKLLRVRYGEPVLMRHYDALPIDPSSNKGFGLHTITTHEHNGHNPAESDGYTQSFFFPGQFYDYEWPMVIAGHDSINTNATDPKAGSPDGHGGIRNLQGDPSDVMSTHWFHDHMLDFTAQNVYKGNAAMMNYYSSVDRGNEAIDDGVNLRFPSGEALDWGNRDYDINLVLADKAWDSQGQMFFNIFNHDGFMGDQVLTNWLWKPYFKVRARQYRLRILNGAVSRYFKFALVQEVDGTAGELAGKPGTNVSYNLVPFYMIANDGNIMEHAVYFDGNTTISGLTNMKGELPVQAIAERYDIIVNFAQFEPGTKLYLVNLLEHQNGKGPNRRIPLADVLNGTYAPLVQNGQNQTDTAVAMVMQFRVVEYDGVDKSMNPADYVAGKKTMIPLVRYTDEQLANATHRTFEFGQSNGTDGAPWTIKTDGGSGLNMDPRRLSAAPAQGQLEIWHLQGTSGWSHPVHVHFEEGQIYKRGGKAPPEWEKWARKDVYRVGNMADSTDSVDIAIRFREFLGSFVEHCHNTQHEDHAMLLRWDLEKPGQVRVMPTPMPSWDGIGYVPTIALPTFRSGDVKAKEDAAKNPDYGRLGD